MGVGTIMKAGAWLPSLCWLLKWLAMAACMLGAPQLPRQRLPGQASSLIVAVCLHAACWPRLLQARRVLLLAFGENKAAVVRQAVEGPLTEQVRPALSWGSAAVPGRPA
jgi:hypothetical protein